MIFLTLAVPDLNHPVNVAVQEEAVMGDDDDRARITQQGILENVLRFQV